MGIKGRIPRPSPALVLAVVALFVALSGTAVAAGVVPLAKRALVADNAKKLQGKTTAQIVTLGEQREAPRGQDRAADRDRGGGTAEPSEHGGGARVCEDDAVLAQSR